MNIVLTRSFFLRVTTRYSLITSPEKTVKSSQVFKIAVADSEEKRSVNRYNLERLSAHTEMNKSLTYTYGRLETFTPGCSFQIEVSLIRGIQRTAREALTIWNLIGRTGCLVFFKGIIATT